ncbi:AP-3 complex subunit delta [Heracleum sosnowskyi]|uniref:AP-3 complex subunit delta n=1 Tax=Heracleum sosnowskyi TaxID=360622 RepID=A0AAD8MGH4_9APIA|nr:AP-3 complex subunit delta [Heracleum sosnowskyi]
MPSTPSLMDTLFQRSLEDLIKGLRLHNPGPPTSNFIEKNIQEIKKEIKSTDLNTKSIALQKLTYLHSIYSINMSNWASFHAIELTSSPFFGHKKIGYLAVTMSFCDTNEVLLLMVNQLRKDLGSPCEFEVSLALETIGIVINQELAVNLIDHVFVLISSSKSFVRKKAIVTLLRVFEVYPDGIKVCFKRLVENLENGDGGCLSASVGVFCELAMRDVKLCLPLAPEFYKVLVECRNNWVLIKVLKVFGKLAELEPRLGKKLVEPVCEHLRSNGAKSVVFECVRTIVSCLSEFEYALKLAVEKIREFLVDDDPNLKYLGLQGLSIVSRKCLWAVVENKDAVIKSLSDADVNIKSEALRLVMAMVSEDNVTEICKVLISYAIKSDPEFCNEILAAILLNCGSNVYELIIDFDWYVSLLGEMARIQHCQKGEEIENQLIDIGMRVKDVRPELVRVGRDLLIDPALLGNPFIHRILSAAAWLCGEYVQFSKNPFEVMEALLQPRTNLLPASIRAVYIHSALKVLSFCLHSYLLPNETDSYWVDSDSGEAYLPSESEILGTSNPSAVKVDQIYEQRDLSLEERRSSIENGLNTNVAHEQSSSSVPLKQDLFTEQSIKNLLALVETALQPLSGSHEVEIQERVCNVLGLIEMMQGELPNSVVQGGENIEMGESKASDIIRVVHDAFSEDLGPISSSSQERVPLPDGLLLEENLDNLDKICGEIELPMSTSFSLGRPASDEHDTGSLFNNHDKDESELSKESTSLLTEHRKRHGLYYLSSDKKEVVSDYYPPANEPKTQSNDNDVTEDLVKLTEQSFLPKKKPNQVKARPKVVKLDEGDGGIPSVIKKTESTDNAISGAVPIPLSQEVIPSDKLSSNVKGKEKLHIGQSFESNEHTANVDNSELDTSRSKRSKKHKERKHRSSGKTAEERDKNGVEDKQKSGHHHTRHKARHRADADLKVVAQTPVIPDFLL